MFITEEEFTNLDYKTLDMILERVHNKSVEATLKLLPDIIVGLTVKTQGIQTIFKDFKEKFPDLAGREPEIIEAVQNLEIADGSKDLSQLLLEAAKSLQAPQIDVPREQPQNIDEVERLINGIF